MNEPALIVKLENSFAEKFGAITLESYRDTKLPFISFLINFKSALNWNVCIN